MSVAIVYYSRSGFTERVVNVLRGSLINSNLSVDVFRVTPVVEYARPLHLNPRTLYDTLVRRGTDVRFEPGEPDLLKYNLLVLASPIWYSTLASPAQEFLRLIKRYNIAKPIMTITTSGLDVDYSGTARKVMRELAGVEPVYSVNISIATIRNYTKLSKVIEEIMKHVINMTKGQ